MFYFILIRHTPHSKIAAILVFFCLLANLSQLPRLKENKGKKTKMAAILE